MMHTQLSSAARRAALLLAVAAGHLAAAVPGAAPADSGRAVTGAVTGLRIVPGAQRAEVIIGTQGEVSAADFTLSDPHRVVVDLSGAALQAAPALYDRVARAGITNVRMAQYRPDVVRLVIEFDGPRPYTINRGAGDVRLVLDGRSQFDPWSSEAPALRDARSARGEEALPTRTQPGSTKPRISVTYVDADIRDVIAAFAAFSGRTIVVGRAVNGTIPYLDIKDKPWDIAFRAVLESQQLAATEDASGIIRVDSYVNILARQASEPLETRSLRLNYANATALMPTVRALLSRDCTVGQAQQGAAALSTGSTGGQATAQGQGCIIRGSVMSDSLTNSLFITDVPSRLDDLQSFVRSLDIRTPQVAIKAKIILVNRRQLEDLGLRYDLGTSQNFFSSVVQRPDPLQLQPIDTDGDGIPDAVGGPPTQQNFFRLGGREFAGVSNASSVVPNPTLQLMFSAALGRYDVTAFLDALSETSLADIQAEPSIVTLNNRPAQIFAGDQIPFRQVDAGALGGGATTARAVTQLVEAGIRLAVTPQVSANRMITMTIRAENSSATSATSDGNPLINRQEATSQLLVADGETAVIGGLTVTSVTVVRSGIPYLKDLPIIGAAFRRQSRTEEKRDLLLLITPHILDDGDRADASRNR